MYCTKENHTLCSTLLPLQFFWPQVIVGNKTIPDKCPVVGGSVASAPICCSGLEHQRRAILDSATFI